MISNSNIFSNSAGVSGGGLYLVANSNVTGTLTLLDSQVSYNQAEEDSGGIRSTRVSNSNNYAINVNVIRSEVSANSTPNALGFIGGGGLGVNYSEVLIMDSVLKDNKVETGSAFGGGVLNVFSNITIVRSTIMNNEAASSSGPFQAGGGGLANSDGSMLISNSTIGGNQATGSATGGAILVTNFFGSGPSTVTLINSTVNGNSTDATAGAVSTLDMAGGQPISV